MLVALLALGTVDQRAGGDEGQGQHAVMRRDQLGLHLLPGVAIETRVTLQPRQKLLALAAALAEGVAAGVQVGQALPKVGTARVCELHPVAPVHHPRVSSGSRCRLGDVSAGSASVLYSSIVQVADGPFPDGQTAFEVRQSFLGVDGEEGEAHFVAGALSITHRLCPVLGVVDTRGLDLVAWQDLDRRVVSGGDGESERQSAVESLVSKEGQAYMWLLIVKLYM